jgi:DNA-directed RNA polymerase subunit N (RpoN/RPB10)
VRRASRTGSGRVNTVGEPGREDVHTYSGAARPVPSGVQMRAAASCTYTKAGVKRTSARGCARKGTRPFPGGGFPCRSREVQLETDRVVGGNDFLEHCKRSISACYDHTTRSLDKLEEVKSSETHEDTVDSLRRKRWPCRRHLVARATRATPTSIRRLSALNIRAGDDVSVRWIIISPSQCCSTLRLS